MLLNKSIIALCSSGGLSSITSPCSGYRRTVDLTSPSRNPSARHYATTRGGRDSGSSNDDSTSESQTKWPSSVNPTPYEIFGHTRHTPYSKARYYELVKQYHPDRHHLTTHDGVPHLKKLERYRLVVAANDILSDPRRRRQYDLYGAGWDSKADITGGNSRTADREWRTRPGNASMNATWEDWERWYQEQSGEKQDPRFMSNGGFAAIIFLFTLAAVWGQITRAGKHGTALVEMRDEKHNAISRDLWRRQSENAPLSRQGRIETFLRQREGWGSDEPVSHTNGSPASRNGSK